MKKKTPKLHLMEGKGNDELEVKYKLLGPEQIMELPLTDDVTYSLKVIAVAYYQAMSEFTGDAVGAESQQLLNECGFNIARGYSFCVK